MFKRLTDFSYKRSVTEALGFYIAYFMLFFIVGCVIDLIASPFGAASSTNAFIIILIVFVVMSLMISFAILDAKHLWKPIYVIIALLSGILSLGWAFFGLLLLAYLTTRGGSAEKGTTEPNPVP